MKIESIVGPRDHVHPEELIHFPLGLVGFQDPQDFVILDIKESSPFLLLQSSLNKELCFPILQTQFLVSEIEFNLTGLEKNMLEFEEEDLLTLYSIVNLSEKIEDCTANIKAPLVVNHTKARAVQTVLLDVRHSLEYPAGLFFQSRLSADNENI